MAADGLAIKSPEDIVGVPDRDTNDNHGGIDPYWISMYQMTKAVDDDPNVKKARARRERKDKERADRKNKTGRNRRSIKP